MSDYTNLTKILIIRLTSIGDVVLTTHLPRLLKKTNPNINITFLSSELTSSLLQNNPNIDRVLTYAKDNENSKLIEKLINEEFDIVLDLQKNIHSKRILKSINSDIRIIDKYRSDKLKMVYMKKFPEKIVSVPERYYNTCKDICIDDNKCNEIWLEKDVKADKYLPFDRTINKIETIGIAPEANHFTKRWQEENYIHVAERLLLEGFRVKVFGKESNTFSNINDARLENYAGKLSLVETSEKIDECDLFISNDTGLMHIASARQVPVILIYGSSVREFGFLPFRNEFELLENELDCRPCSHIGRSKCPKGHFKCMRDTSADDVLKALNILKNRLLQYS